MSEIIVDGKKIEAPEGENLLQVCLRNDIFIPNMCYLKSVDPPSASCRLCFVEIEGGKRPVTSCTERVRDGLVVHTGTEQVRRLQKTAFKLLMSNHHIDPKHCPMAKRCQLHRIAKFLNVKLSPKPLERLPRELPEEVDLGFFTYYPFRCILCGRCVRVCRNKSGRSLLTFANRGFETVIDCLLPPNASMEECPRCTACQAVCPTAALILKQEYRQALDETA